MKQPDERGRCSRAVAMERICRAAMEGLSLYAIAARERTTVETLKGWLCEDEAFRTRYEQARALGHMFVLDEVLATADAIPGTGRADIRLKLSARKWWAAQTARTAAATLKAMKEDRAQAEAKAARERETAEREAKAMERVRAYEAEEARRAAAETPDPDRWVKPDGTIVYGPRPAEPTPPAPEPPPAHFQPAPPKPKRQPEFVSWLYKDPQMFR